MLHQQIKDDMKEAMRAKDAVRLTTLRSLLTAFTNELVAKKQKPDDKVTDEMALSVLARAAKQRKDSIEQFEKGGRNDLAENEKKELATIESYLPEMMNEDEIRKSAEAKKATLGITDPSQKGLLMGALMKDLKGKADGGIVKNIVDSLF
jgi:hypothetical protein